VEIDDAEREYVNIDQSATMTNIQQQQTILATCSACSDNFALPGYDGGGRPSCLTLSPGPQLF
jgi:hypothetical protein